MCVLSECNCLNNYRTYPHFTHISLPEKGYAALGASGGGKAGQVGVTGIFTLMCSERGKVPLTT